ncbi:MAG: hypothetical protein ACI4U3_00565 [Traorella sp.]
MKKIGSCLLVLFLLVGCNAKKSIEVEYANSNHNKIVEEVLKGKLDKKETQTLFEQENSIDVYYELLEDDQVELTVVNNIDGYYFSGEIDLDACPYKLSVTGLAPNGYVSQTMECPNFEDQSKYQFTGSLLYRSDDSKYDVKYEIYSYQDNMNLFDYVLDLDEIVASDLKELASYLYTENVLLNYQGEMWVRVYPKEAYDEAYKLDSEAGWNNLDKNYLKGRIWIDAANDIAEVYIGDELIDRINFAK